MKSSKSKASSTNNSPDLKRIWIAYIAVALTALAMTACGVTKYLPEDGYMLTQSKVKPDKKTHRKERLSAGELEKYVPQRSSKKFLGTNLPTWLYLVSDPESDTGWSKFLRNIGSEPVIFDSMQTVIGERNLKLYMNSRGFYESDSDYDIKFNDKKKRAKVKYSVSQGEPYRIRNINYDFHDTFVEQVIRADSASTLLASGDIFDTKVLEAERQRIADHLHNSGYYNFSVSNILFKADTTVGDHLADITMVVKQHLSGYNEKGEAIYENNSIYSLKDIYIVPNYDPILSVTDSTYFNRFDTTDYRGLKIISSGKQKIKPQTLRRAVSLHPDYTYNYDQVRKTYNGILGLPYYKNARILFDEVEQDEHGIITFVSEEEDGEIAHTSERLLDCTIYCTPAMKQAYTVELEASTTSAFYGIKGSASYLNRNIFGGSELLNIGINGGYEIYPKPKDGSAKRQNSFEVGTSASITFPRFLSPFPVDRANRAIRPQTRVEISYNFQRRPYYDRTITGGNLHYMWSNDKHSTFGLRPLDINVIQATVDPDFLKSITNPYLKSSYESQLVPAIGASYAYVNPKLNARGDALNFRLNIEAAGNITDLFAMAFGTKKLDSKSGEMVYMPFNIRFSQYTRVETSISHSIVLADKTSFVYRFLVGIGLPYGNASALPVDRQFYSGGSNSMRGWPARTLGPGGEGLANAKAYASQTSNMKLEVNAEFRFPLWNALRGAVFFDAGNIWQVNIKGSTADDPAVFRLKTFPQQIGLNTGLGIRFDFGVAVVRLDWGIILHNPNEPAGNRWINNFKLRNTSLSFGVGYPF